jgi:hypothetical protein
MKGHRFRKRKKRVYPDRCIEGVHYKKINHAVYKYELLKNIDFETNIFGYDVNLEFFDLNIWGRLTVKKGYLSDGPSGPTIDTASFMRGAFFHDVLYQMLRMRLIPEFEKDFDKYRKISDNILIQICKIDGMNFFRRQRVYYGLRIGGRSSALPNNLM